jgi:hypothetical protein
MESKGVLQILDILDIQSAMAQSLVLPGVDWSPFKKEEMYKLSLMKNWPKLLWILESTMIHDFGVVDSSVSRDI